MLSIGWIITIAVTYLCLLFLIAYRGDNLSRKRVKPYRYALAQGVHCTSWAFFGTVTQSAIYGWSFAPTYIGAIVVFLVFHRVQLRLLSYCKQQNITSIADLVGSHFGRSSILSGFIAITALVAVVPYISLQLRAVTASVTTLTGVATGSNTFFDLALLVTLAMVSFAFLFGTRRLSLAEQHNGLMDVVAFESMVKLIAFMIIGAFACWSLFDGVVDLVEQSLAQASIKTILEGRPDGIYIFIVHACLGALSMFCLPRQFHVSYIECNHPDELKVARWAFPLYLFAINFFILPIALAGLVVAPEYAHTDMFMLSLPIIAERPDISTVAFIGGLSASTSMVLIALLALSIMMANDVVIPSWLHLFKHPSRRLSPRLVLNIRRATIIVVMLLAYGYYQLTLESLPLVNSGLIALALLAQLAPGILATILWPRASGLGVIAGLLMGWIVWFWQLLLPALNTHQPMLDTDLADGVVLSLILNFSVFWVVSMLRPQIPHVSVPNLRDSIETSSLTWARLYTVLSTFYSDAQLRIVQRRLDIDLFSQDNHATVPADVMVRVERELSAVIGTSASRLLLESVSEQHSLSVDRMVDWAAEASKLYRFNRELLQASVENIPQGISVVDQKLRLVAWNQRYADIFDYPTGMLETGIPVEKLLRFNAHRGLLSSHETDIEKEIQKRLDYLRSGSAYSYQRQQGTRIIELHGNPMPGGGFVTTYSDITEKIAAQNQLRQVNEELEQRVAERTEQLLLAKQAEEYAHRSKSRFFAAVSHDLMQPFNAASLFTEMLVAKSTDSQRPIAAHLKQSLEQAEELLTMLLDMTKLDSGHLKPEYQSFDIGSVLQPLVERYRYTAHEKQLRFHYIDSRVRVRSDRRLLTRVFQNLLSNALRYTHSGRVTVGCKRTNNQITVWVIDTGPGIPEHKQREIFREFHQLQSDSDNPGLGLGLSIVERICRLMELPLTLRSMVGKGTAFGISFDALPPLPNESKTKIAEEFDTAELILSDFHVLIIDNDPQVLLATSELLKGWGAQITTAESLSDVSSLKPCDLIFADYHLNRGLTGVDVIQTLREKWSCDTPAIINSADPTESVRQAAMAVEAYFIPKPLKVGALKRLLKRIRGG
ncbi:PAS domain S-box-containing protein [Idiomarina fontislapidosi]|uniref:histidine kinase n=1 Tax=Idiomarina fontislapidosi TaxID=263723 RepID=A0A432Y8H9_9GAMM|nr:PAS domain-containing hybrid sensor histidine kinase/response regulator [Idiomarina fontislapidosi]PYE33846.1 PAS domain S-box-containing protein [Idiomarina fontislapidosi]RUO57237.1 sodium:proline symporter [Idiomarina fontislapidosi]